MDETLAALERREADLDVFLDCERQAREYVNEHGSDKLVEELRKARTEKRRIRLGTPNTLVLLHHIDRLEAELAKEPYRG